MQDHTQNSVIQKNEIILPKRDDTYMEVRHIVLKGNNKDIGKAIADIAKENYGVKLLPFINQANRKTREEYIAKHDQILSQRMKGVEESFQLDTNHNFNTSLLMYDIGQAGCSAIFFPREYSANNHAFVARNTDFYTANFAQFTNQGTGAGNNLISRNYALEIYPEDEGYASIVLGSMDLMSGIFDGLNSEGLAISCLVDQNVAKEVKKDFDDAQGLAAQQFSRLILEKAKTCQEAEAVARNNQIYMIIDGFHYMVTDRSGTSLIIEFSEKDMSPIFTYIYNKPRVMTNHPVHKYPQVSDFPATDPEANYNTFNRFAKLNEYLIKNNGKKFSDKDGFDALSLVYGFCNDSSEGPSLNLPLRTLWPVITDLDNCSMKVKFYLNDGPDKTLNFSEIFKFRLENK